MKLKLLGTFLFLIVTLNTFAQKAILRGNVADVNTGETIVGASVTLDGTTTGAMTDFDGNFEIKNINPGTYTIVCRFISYEAGKFENIVFQANEEKILDFKLGEAVVQVEEVKVVARVNRESENLLLMQQKESALMAENIGAAEMSRKGAGDVASGVKKVSGVSMMGSKQLFVRGLDDRFNSAQLNGLPITSPDPLKKVIKLDIFPSDIVKVLNVNKVYSATNYADYTGALINIETKDFPEEAFWSINFGSGYNSYSTLQPFLKMESAGIGFLGFDVNSRKALTPNSYKEVNRLLEVGPDFNYQSYGYTSDKALPNIDFGFNGGKLFEFNSRQKLGFLVSTSFSNNYEYRPDVLDVSYNKQQNDDGNFINQEYSYNTLFSALLNLAYTHNKNNSFKYNFLFLNNGEDGLKEKRGYKRDWNEDNLLLIRNAEYINYKLLSNQLSGTHVIAPQLEVNWRGSFMKATYDVPDRREIIFQQNANQEWQIFTLNNGNDTKRVITEQNTWEANGYVDATYHLNNEKGTIQVGLLSRYKSQDYHSYFMGYNFLPLGIRNLIVDPTNPNDYLNDATIKKIDVNTTDDMGYQGMLLINSGFADFTYKLNEKMVLNAGLRAEQSSMTVISNTNKIDNDEVQYQFNNIDLFPAFNLKYGLNDASNLRFAMSRTVTRPSFFEKSPARMIPEAGKKQERGNPGTKENPQVDGSYLENSYSNNIDLKYEIYPDNGELISIGIYYKQIIEPIERLSILMGGSDQIYTYRNYNDNATAAGAEFEIKKKFGNLFTGINAAYIYTHITLPESSTELNQERPLQGASPYLINADLGYNLKLSDHKSSYVGLIYNVYGKRLFAVGVSGTGNQYELPFHALDLVIKNKINEKLELNFSVKNMLNSEIRFVQDVYTDLSQPELLTGTVTYNSYRKGISAGFSVNYKF
ncbi:MAG: carboxypeptidase-like regulatory domain-containing protein [Prolixibacteraceae bacterium]